MRFTIAGMLAYDGSYELDLDASPYTMRELHWIKQIAGVRLNEFESATVAGDSDVLIALVVIALVRAGKIPKEQVPETVERLYDAQAGQITVEADEDDAVPPDSPSPSEPESEPGSNANTTSSSETSNGIGDVSPETLQLATGQQG